MKSHIDDNLIISSLSNNLSRLITIEFILSEGYNINTLNYETRLLSFRPASRQSRNPDFILIFWIPAWGGNDKSGVS